jgi:hypothetical protein
MIVRAQTNRGFQRTVLRIAAEAGRLAGGEHDRRGQHDS